MIAVNSYFLYKIRWCIRQHFYINHATSQILKSSIIRYLGLLFRFGSWHLALICQMHFSYFKAESVSIKDREFIITTTLTYEVEFSITAFFRRSPCSVPTSIKTTGSMKNWPRGRSTWWPSWYRKDFT